MPCNGDCNQGRECNCECKKETVTKQHKWHKEIKAWADGAVIEGLNNNTGKWEEIAEPYWFEHDKFKYRIKPQPKEPQYLYVFQTLLGNIFIGTNGFSNKCDTYIGKIKLEVEDD